MADRGPVRLPRASLRRRPRRPVLDRLRRHAASPRPHLPAFLPPGGRIFLVEDPERGLHPNALGALHATLSALPGSQLLATTQSPALRALFRPAEVFSLERREDGTVKVARGDVSEGRSPRSGRPVE